jgi:nicotinamidase-related amidase
MIEKAPGLQFGPLSASAVHLCVDMQRMFDSGTPWATPWLRRVLPRIVHLTEACASQTIFTRFIPIEDRSKARGTWGRYYDRWREMTLGHLDPVLVDLVPELRLFVPPASVFDKNTYSPWTDGRLAAHLTARRANTVIITGGETDVCVLATVLGAVDAGLRVIVCTDALCGSVDETHDALIDFYHERLAEQIEAAEVSEILEAMTAR